MGIIPAAGGTQTLPRVIGRSRALDMLLTNRWIDAREAHRFQLVDHMVPREELVARAEAMAEKIASCDPLAVRYAKEAVVRGSDLPLAAGLELEKSLAVRLSSRARPEKGS